MGKQKHLPPPTLLPTLDVYRVGKGKRKQKGLLAFHGKEKHKYRGNL